MGFRQRSGWRIKSNLRWPKSVLILVRSRRVGISKYKVRQDQCIDADRCIGVCTYNALPAPCLEDKWLFGWLWFSTSTGYVQDSPSCTWRHVDSTVCRRYWSIRHTYSVSSVQNCKNMLQDVLLRNKSTRYSVVPVSQECFISRRPFSLILINQPLDMRDSVRVAFVAMALCKSAIQKYHQMNNISSIISIQEMERPMCLT